MTEAPGGPLRLLPYGDRAWLIETTGDPVTLARWLRSRDWDAEVVPGAATCLVRFEHPAPDRAAMGAMLANASLDPGLVAIDTKPFAVTVRYSGMDLESVAHSVGMAPARVVQLHSQATYRVAFLGFAPGFAYLTGLPAELRLPRRAVPRTRVPAGSVAIADEYTAIYPGESPGGWHLLGSTDQWLFDPRRHPPSLLAPGMLVRFVAAT